MAQKGEICPHTQALMAELVKENPDLRIVREEARQLGLPGDDSIESLMALVLERIAKNPQRRKKSPEISA